MGKTQFLAEPGRQNVIISRVFDAPRNVVFRIYNDPKMLPQWWGPRIFETNVEQMDVRPGGSWHVVQRDRTGKRYNFRGVYHKTDAPKRIVRTFEFDGEPENEILEITNFEEEGGKTKVTITSIFQSVRDRDGMLEARMEDGATESMDRLEELLKKSI